MKNEIKTADKFLSDYLGGNPNIESLTPFALIEIMQSYAAQFTPKWNEFKSDRSSDPDPLKMVFIVHPPEQLKSPELIAWKSDHEVIEGSIWIYLNEILPNSPEL